MSIIRSFAVLAAVALVACGGHITRDDAIAAPGPEQPRPEQPRTEDPLPALCPAIGCGENTLHAITSPRTGRGDNLQVEFCHNGRCVSGKAVSDNTPEHEGAFGAAQSCEFSREQFAECTFWRDLAGRRHFVFTLYGADGDLFGVTVKDATDGTTILSAEGKASYVAYYPAGEGCITCHKVDPLTLE